MMSINNANNVFQISWKIPQPLSLWGDGLAFMKIRPSVFEICRSLSCSVTKRKTVVKEYKERHMNEKKIEYI